MTCQLIHSFRVDPLNVYYGYDVTLTTYDASVDSLFRLDPANVYYSSVTFQGNHSFRVDHVNV